MNAHRILAATITVFLGARVLAVTDMWDGGGADDDISTGANWFDNTAPTSSLTNTDLFFGASTTTSLTPNFDTTFNVHGITAGFIGCIIGGQTVHVGAGGIVNNDPLGSAFANFVSFSGVANATINAASGSLIFEETVTLPGTLLTVTGAENTSFTNFAGASALLKSGAGEMIWNPNLTNNFDVTVSAGTLTLDARRAFDNPPDVFAAGNTIAINGSSNLDTDETLTVQNGGDVMITGGYSNTTASTITVTGAGSSFTGNSSLGFNGGGTLNVLAGGTVTGTAIYIGLTGDGTASVSGSGSSLNGTALTVGIFGNMGALTFSSGSTGQFTTIDVDSAGSGGTIGLMHVQSGATVTGTGLAIADFAAATIGALTVTGAGSALTLTGAAAATIGAASDSAGTLNVNSSGTFNSGTGETTVNATGKIHIDGGTYNSNGNLTLVGGKLERLAGVFTLAAGTTFTVKAGGVATFTGSFNNNTDSNIVVTGSGSTLTTTSTLSINGGSSLVASVGGDVSTGGCGVSIGTSGNGTVSVTNAGSTLTAGILTVGGLGNSGSIVFSNAASGSFTAIQIDSSSTAGTSGAMTVQSGATVTGTSLTLANNAAANTGTLSIFGAGSALTLSGSTAMTIGATSASSGTLNVLGIGTFNSTTGTMTVNATGNIAIMGGTYNSNGNLTLNGGQLTRDSNGTFTLDPGRTFTVQNGGDATFTGAFGAAASTTYNITGTGSTLTVTGTTTIGMPGGGTATVNIGSGGTFTTGTGQTTVNATGDLNVNAGGTMIVRGDMTVKSALDIAGTVVLDANAPAPGQETDDLPLANLPPNDFSFEEDANGFSMGEGAAVPEPSVVMLALLGAFASLPRRRRRQSAILDCV